MRRHIISLFTLLTGALTAQAVDDNTVEIAFDGTSAKVTVASNIQSYITNQSSGSHVRLVQSESVGASTGEIYYVLSGTSSDGEFYLEGNYKCTLTFDALTLTNPNGPAINIQNGKRINVSLKNGTESTLTDGANEDYKGCFHSKGHTEFKGKGTLNVKGNSRHGIYSKEYVSVKNCNINVTAAEKDGIHCQEYFLMESGTVNISNPKDDGIQVEIKGTASTGRTTDHEDEDSGNLYQEGGTISITGHGGVCIKADGTITYSGGTQNFVTSDVVENNATGISAIHLDDSDATNLDEAEAVYDLSGHQLSKARSLRKGIYVVKKGNKINKIKVSNP